MKLHFYFGSIESTAATDAATKEKEETMRNTLILMVLISMALATPALADGRHGERYERSDHRRVEREYRNYARHDRGENYGHFQKRMKHLRKDLKHEQRENRRLERKNTRQRQRIADHRYARHDRHNGWRPAPVVVVPRRAYRPLFFPQIVVRIPINW